MKLSGFKINRLICLGLGVLGAVTVTLRIEKPAEAALEVCNSTHGPVNTAVGYSRSGKWYASGWWNLDPGECAIVIGGKLRNEKIYIHAKSRYRKRHWGGKYSFCVTDPAFTLEDRPNCERRERFFEVYVGKDPDHVVYLTWCDGNIFGLCYGQEVMPTYVHGNRPYTRASQWGTYYYPPSSGYNPEE